MGRAMQELPPDTVTAAELVRSFSRCREEARERPLYISNHGRKTHVLIGIELFDALQTVAGTERSVATSADENLVHLFADWIDDAVILFDDTLTIRFANHFACTVCRRSVLDMVDQPFASVLPELAGTLLELHVRRTIKGGQPNTAEIPSPFNPDGWLRVQTFPLQGFTVLIFRDISEEVSRYRLADMKKALIDTMAVHGSIGYARISSKGEIDWANPPLCNFLGLPEERLRAVALSGLVPRQARAAFDHELDKVLRGGNACVVNTELLNNEAGSVAVTVAIGPLNGAYGVEGAILLMICPG